MCTIFEVIKLKRKNSKVRLYNLKKKLEETTAKQSLCFRIKKFQF